jgi:hypothetical protein
MPHRQGHARDSGLGRRVGHLADLPLEGGDRGRVQDDAPLAAVVRLVLAHLVGGDPCDVERRDQVQVDHAPEVVEGVGPVLGERPLRDAAARRIADEVEASEGADRIDEGSLGPVEVGDVAGVEGPA